MTDRSTFCPGLAQRRLCVPPSRHHPSPANLTAGSRAIIPRRLRITRGAACSRHGHPWDPGKAAPLVSPPVVIFAGCSGDVGYDRSPMVAQTLASLGDGYYGGYRYP